MFCTLRTNFIYAYVKIDRIRSYGGEKIMVITIKKKKEEEKIMVIDDPVYIIADPVKIK